MNTNSILICVTSLWCLSFALAFDPSPLQDFCVADFTSSVSVNGFACKDPKLAQASDFSFSGLDIVGNTSNKVGSIVTPVFVFEMAGLNTLGISIVRIDIAPQGINPPHWHPRASEVLTVLEGILEVGFVTSNPENRLITKVLYKGDVFAFPLGLTHFQRNIGKHNAVAIAALNSQNPGIDWAANVLFKSNPQIPSDLLGKAFQTDTNTIDQIKRSI